MTTAGPRAFFLKATEVKGATKHPRLTEKMRCNRLTAAHSLCVDPDATVRLRGGLFVVQAAGNYCIRWLRKNKNAARDPKVCGMVIGIFEDQLNA